MRKAKVNFLICGTQKGGATALDAYLRGHPEVCMAKRKEVHFFDNEKFFRHSHPDYEYYHSNFHLQKEQWLIGESTPIYMYWQSSPSRIWQYNPKMKMIVLLRNPVDRAYSHWNMERLRGAEDLSFWDAITQESVRSKMSLPFQHRVYSYIDRGFYPEQLRRLWRYFEKSQVLILKSEDLVELPKETLNKICTFLGVSELQGVISKSEHTLKYESPMDKLAKDYLWNIFNHHVSELERMLGWDCSKWRNL